MADLKINQLDPIIYVSSGSGAAFNALSDADLFIVKMKVRGTAIGDEDRKLTWLELRNSLNLGQYMPTVGGNFTGDITMNNNKAVKAQQVGAGADINLLSLDSSNRVNVGSTTNLTRIYSSSVPQFVDGTGTYNLITAKNLPSPADIGSYNKTEVDNKLATKFDKAGGDVSGDINLTQNASRLYGYTTDGLKASLAYVTAGNSVNFGHSTLHSNIVSNDVPSWTNGSQAYDIITRANLPAPGDINAYSKSEVDAIAAQKLNLSGGEMTGHLTLGLGKSLFVREAANVTRVGLAAVPALSSLQIGDPGSNLTIKIKSAQNPTVSVAGGAEYTLYHGGNKPSAADLGLSDTVAKAASALQDGSFGIGTSTPHKADAGFLSVNDATQFFVQDGGNTEKRFGNMGAGIHLNYGVVGTGTSTQYRSASLFVDQNNKLISKWSALDSNGSLLSTQTATYFSDTNPPTSSQVGAYSKTEADGLYARKGVNADITALNSLTGALRVGADGTDDLHVATVRQLRIATGATAGAIVGVVGGFVGAVMWFNGPRDRVPAGWLPADGQMLKRTDAPDLWNAVANGSYANISEALWQNSGEASTSESQSNATQRGKYSLGDGSTTFRLPDLNGGQTGTISNAFLRGFGTAGDQSTIGKMALDGAPNITGNFSSDLNGSAWMPFPATNAIGAFFADAAQTNSYHPTSGFDNRTAASRVNIDASRNHSAYGRSANEIRPRAAVGIWIIRISNNFEAANTQFSVNNGAATLPASGTTTVGGAWQSVYSVGGAQDHSVSLQSSRDVGGVSVANLTVTQQAQGSQPFQSSVFKFTSAGALIVPGAAGIGAAKIELSSDQPFIDFHFGNSTADYTHRIIADTASRLLVTSGIRAQGDLATDSTLSGQQIIGRGLYVNGLSSLAGNQGLHLAWNEDAGQGRGSIIVNPGAGVGGLKFRFVNMSNTQQTGFVDFTASGVVEAGYGYRSKAGAGGGTSGNVWNIERGGNGANYLWIDRSAFLIPDGSSDLTLKEKVTASQEGALDRVITSETIEYEWKDKDARGKQRRRGFGAQTQEAIDPMHVSRSVDDAHPLSLDTTAMLADAYDAIKTLKGMIDDLKSEVAELKAAQS